MVKLCSLQVGGAERETEMSTLSTVLPVIPTGTSQPDKSQPFKVISFVYLKKAMICSNIICFCRDQQFVPKEPFLRRSNDDKASFARKLDSSIDDDWMLIHRRCQLDFNWMPI